MTIGVCVHFLVPVQSDRWVAQSQGVKDHHFTSTKHDLHPCLVTLGDDLDKMQVKRLTDADLRCNTCIRADFIAGSDSA
jgi:hypothetical protein